MSSNGPGGELPLSALDHDEETVGGVTLHVVKAGPEDGPPVVLLHGFPEFWYGWRHQIGSLVDAGYRVWAPDQRGYNRSDKPDGIAAYGIDELAADAAGLVEATGHEDAYVVGHDWGAAVGWWTAITRPERVRRLVTINVPHPAVFDQFLLRDVRQTLRSWYMFFFQLPRVPEFLFGLRDFGIGTRLLRSTSREGAFTDADLALYHEAWGQPGAVTGMLNWYRALFRTSPADPGDMRVTPPTLLVWGTEDTALRREMAPRSVEFCDDGRLEFVEGTTHWVQHEEPDRVNDLVGSFLDA